jgi:hypothetical protein
MVAGSPPQCAGMKRVGLLRELTKICQSDLGLGRHFGSTILHFGESILSFSQKKFFHWPSIQEVRNASARALGLSRN